MKPDSIFPRRPGESLSALRYRRRVEVIKHYCGKGKRVGCQCSGCRVQGMRYINSLTIDHIDGDGHNHKTKSGRRLRGYELIAYLIRNDFPRGFAVLCANCNVSKASSGYCSLINTTH